MDTRSAMKTGLNRYQRVLFLTWVQELHTLPPLEVGSPQTTRASCFTLLLLRDCQLSACTRSIYRSYGYSARFFCLEDLVRGDRDRIGPVSSSYRNFSRDELVSTTTGLSARDGMLTSWQRVRGAMRFRNARELLKARCGWSFIKPAKIFHGFSIQLLHCGFLCNTNTTREIK